MLELLDEIDELLRTELLLELLLATLLEDERLLELLLALPSTGTVPEKPVAFSAVSARIRVPF